jgi:hypothetical protein
MPQERHNPFPYPTAKDVEEAPGTREEKAARNIIVRHIPGVARRDYLLGNNDSAPILQGVRDLTSAVYQLLDQIDQPEVSAELRRAGAQVRSILTDHGCPDFEALHHTLKEIAYDNGMVNREETEEEAIAGMIGRLTKAFPAKEIADLDRALAVMKPEHRVIVATGEETEQKEIWQLYNLDTRFDHMLNVAFDS